jgi:hypothetical protein
VNRCTVFPAAAASDGCDAFSSRALAGSGTGERLRPHYLGCLSLENLNTAAERHESAPRIKIEGRVGSRQQLY